MIKGKLLSQNHLAQQHLHKSVVRIIENSLNNALSTNATYFMGIKDTLHIKKEWIDLLTSKFIHHTIDSMTHKGRAIDSNLVNPVTLRAMTGSSSGSAINTLIGINDLGLGTDGGGSVIYPAMSVNLYSVMLAGVGFSSDIKKQSTDNIIFSPSLGLLSFHKHILEEALNLLIPQENLDRVFTIAGDRESLTLFQEQGQEIIIPDTDNREILIQFITDLFKTVDIILIKESHIDIHGYGDSVLGTTSPYYSSLQRLSNKKIGKILNMIGASVFTVPDQEAATGYLIIAKTGMGCFQKAWDMFRKAPELRTKLFIEYFGT